MWVLWTEFDWISFSQFRMQLLWKWKYTDFRFFVKFFFPTPTSKILFNGITKNCTAFDSFSQKSICSKRWKNLFQKNILLLCAIFTKSGYTNLALMHNSLDLLIHICHPPKKESIASRFAFLVFSFFILVEHYSSLQLRSKCGSSSLFLLLFFFWRGIYVVIDLTWLITRVHAQPYSTHAPCKSGGCVCTM